jgi:hypothetical protein
MTARHIALPDITVAPQLAQGAIARLRAQWLSFIRDVQRR